LERTGVSGHPKTYRTSLVVSESLGARSRCAEFWTRQVENQRVKCYLPKRCRRLKVSGTATGMRWLS
jgi:hypothetical protein